LETTGTKSTRTNKVIRKYVFGYTREDFVGFLKTFDIHHRNVVFVRNPHHIRGLPYGTPLFCVGRYEKHKMYEEIMQVAKPRMRLVRIEDFEI
jgi:hypothetical protein